MDKDRGALLEYIIRKEDVNVTELCRRLNIHRKTLYNWFDDKHLSFNIIVAVGKAIGKSLAKYYPELSQSLLPIVYLIEDTDLDVEIFKISMKSFLMTDCVKVFQNGEEAINNLLNVSINRPDQLPDYIFVDLNMPIMNGWEFLSHFHRLDINKSKKIKVYILTSSRSYSDIVKSAGNPLVTEYISKPIELSKMKSIFEDASF